MGSLSSQFKRKFSFCTYRDQRILLGKMNFCKDFVQDSRGDPHPLLRKSADCMESIWQNQYQVEKGNASRMLCQFFPYATYEAAFALKEGAVGFQFLLPGAEAMLTFDGQAILYSCEEHKERIPLPPEIKERKTLLVSCRPGAFDIFIRENGKPEHIHTVYEEKFRIANEYTTFREGVAALYAAGNLTVQEAVSYIDNGIALADVRPIKNEDGSVLLENGRIYFSASIRLWEGALQGIFSWIPGTAEIAMTGVLFFDCGDGRWRNFLASSILYHREKQLWYLWTSSFEYAHILCHAAFAGDPRFGVNVVDVTLMDKAPAGAACSEFLGFTGDEDPDFLYDKEKDRWLMAICRLEPETRKYRYVFFESNEPFSGYRYLGEGLPGEETGGSFVRDGNALCFVCGNSFDARSEYRIYREGGMEKASFNHPDGGFRGWGSVFPLPMGSRIRYFWLTFDRHNGSTYNWSYGNLYCFEAEE